MSLNMHKQNDHKVVRIDGIDLKRVFQEAYLETGHLRIPTDFYALTDYRPPSDVAYADALKGVAPTGSGLGRFDPSVGPFSLDGAVISPWAQSLDFLRDIRDARTGSVQLSQLWVREWLYSVATAADKAPAFYTASKTGASKTNQLIWRARRVLNCLSHVLPLVGSLDRDTAHMFWRTLMRDISKLGTPNYSLWANLKDGIDPLSPRAIWLRAIALLAVESSFPGLLLIDLVEKSSEQIGLSIQNDGMMQGGSVIGTLSACADLCMVLHIPQVMPVLRKVQNALASLRRKDGTLVTFGKGSSDYVTLLNAVLGPGPHKPSSLLLTSGITRMSACETNVWLSAPQSNSDWGASCEIEAYGENLLTNIGSMQSAIALSSFAEVTNSRSKRRDENDRMILESTADFNISAQTYHTLRQIRMSHNGLSIEGEDWAKSESNIRDACVQEICFVIPSSCTCHLSQNKQSVLIVTSQQQAWRFRAQGMDIRVEKASDDQVHGTKLHQQHFIICRYLNMQRSNDFRAKWTLLLEELV